MPQAASMLGVQHDGKVTMWVNVAVSVDVALSMVMMARMHVRPLDSGVANTPLPHPAALTSVSNATPVMHHTTACHAA